MTFLGGKGASSHEGRPSASEGSVFAGGTCASASLAGGGSALDDRGHAVADFGSRPLAGARVEDPPKRICLSAFLITVRHSGPFSDSNGDGGGVGESAAASIWIPLSMASNAPPAEEEMSRSLRTPVQWGKWGGERDPAE